MTHRQRIAKEYNMPCRDVILGFARQRNSKRLTAKTLEIPRGAFNRLLDLFDLHDEFYTGADLKAECKPVGPGWEKGKKCLTKRKPLLYEGVIYYPGEPKHDELFDTVTPWQRNRMIHAAKQLT